MGSKYELEDTEQCHGSLQPGENGLVPAVSVESLYFPKSTGKDEGTDEEVRNNAAEEVEMCGRNLRTKWMRTLLLTLGYMGTGMTYTVPGPSLIDLEIRTGASTKDITFMFTLRALGGLLASLLSGPLYDIFNADIIMGLGYGFGCFFIVIAPWWKNLMAMCVSLGLAGFFSAAMNVGVNYCCIGIWKKKNPPFLLFLSFMNHVAAAVIPPVVKVLLLPPTPPNTLQVNSTLPYQTLSNSSHDESQLVGLHNGTIRKHSPDDVMVQYAFMLPGSAYAICCVVHLLLFFCGGCQRSSSYTGRNLSSKIEAGESTRKLPLFPGSLAYTVLLLSMFAVMSGAPGTLEETFYMFLFTYLVKHLGWTKGEAAIINTVLLLASFISLLIFMVISRFVRPNFSILILVSLIFLPCLGLCLPVTKIIVWIAIAFIAVGLGPLCASVVSWMNDCFPMQGKLTAFFFFTIYVSRMIASITMGHVFEAMGLGWFVYINVIIVSAAVISVVMVNIFTMVPYCKVRLPSGMEKEQEKFVSKFTDAKCSTNCESSDMLEKKA